MGSAFFFPATSRARESGCTSAIWLREKSEPITQEGVNGTAFVISPDSQWVAGIGPDQKGYLYPVGGGEPRVIPGLNPREQPITFSSDSHSLYVYQPGELPALVNRVDLQTGKRSLWKQLMPSDPAGVETIASNPDDA